MDHDMGDAGSPDSILSDPPASSPAEFDILEALSIEFQLPEVNSEITTEESIPPVDSVGNEKPQNGTAPDDQSSEPPKKVQKITAVFSNKSKKRGKWGPDQVTQNPKSPLVHTPLKVIHA
jgi:hypothetical protein